MRADLQKTREDHTGGFLSHFAIVDITDFDGSLKSTIRLPIIALTQNPLYLSLIQKQLSEFYQCKTHIK